jgi:octaprenyl-diphosphate synthase
MVMAVVPAGARSDVLDRLSSVCADRALDDLGARIAELLTLVREDLVTFEADLATLPTGGESLVARSAEHLLGLGGKRLRPTCVMLASRVGSGFDPAACDLSVAVELVHSATLLHDDVIDLGDARRGAPAARTVYGNAASIFAGDWLLIEALRRVTRAGVEGTLVRLFDVIEEMIFAESLQLESKGKLDTSRDVWTRIVEGKTASLFRWAMFAGARAGGLGASASEALETYGVHLGMAFQAVDDVLDLVGDSRATGKGLFADLAEGKMTWPLIVGLERRPELADAVERLVAGPNGERAPLEARVVAGLRDCGAVDDCLAFAREHARSAVACLDRVPGGRATDALVTVARAAVERRK